MINLEKIKLETLKSMETTELEDLAVAIRQNIITNVSQTGGHLSSNLGAVELTIALHYVFNSPFDKLIFDVSHQTYTHKILTGRSLEQLRTINGISGFTKMHESEHDVFEAGHSSTSIAAGLGFAIARENGAEIGDIVAIIGDASITNGLAFEALNLLGDYENRKMIIIINDNEMSISKNVGALAKTFNKIQVGKGYHFIKRLTPKFIKRLARKISGSVKSYIYNDRFFHSLGFTYIEGINGHSFKELIKYFKYAKEAKNSVILHVKTIKGKGYKFAEEDKVGDWHNTPPFIVETGELKNPPFVTYGEELGKFLVQKIAEDHWKRLIVITPAMSLGSGLDYFAKAYPQNFIDVGIAEETSVVMASSLSISGFVPFVFIYSSFLQRAYDEILHDVARTNQHVIFCIDRAGIVGGDGDTHQGIYDVAFLKTIPNVMILEPKCLADLYTMVEYAYMYHGVYAIRYPKKAIEYPFPKITYGKWQVVRTIESKVIITYGNNVYKVNSYLENHPEISGIGLLDAYSLKPLDAECLDQLYQKNAKIFVLDEVIKTGSLGQDIINYYAIKNCAIKVKTYSLPDDYLICGTDDEVRNYYNLTVEEIIKKIITN